MVVYIVLRNRDMRNATNVFLLNLSVADLLVVLICMPSALAEFYGKDVWYLGPIMCKYYLGGGYKGVRVVLICMPSALAEFYGKDVWYLGPIMCEYHGG